MPYTAAERELLAQLAERLDWLAGSVSMRRAAEDRAFAVMQLRAIASAALTVAGELERGA